MQHLKIIHKQTYWPSVMRAHSLLTLWTKWRRESVLAGIMAPVRLCAGKGAPWPAPADPPSSPHLAAYTHLTSASRLTISFQHRIGAPKPLLIHMENEFGIQIDLKLIDYIKLGVDALYLNAVKKFNLIYKIEIEKCSFT